MKRYIMLTVMLLATLSFAYAQDSADADAAPSMIPEAGDFTGAILFGRGNFATSNLTVPPPPMWYNSQWNWTIAGTAPYNNTVVAGSNDVSNMVGAEMRYFLTKSIALKLSGGAIIRNTPSSLNIQGILGDDPNTPNVALIPAYDQVVADNQSDLNVNLGGEYHFAPKYNRLSPWAGLTIPFYYARRSAYDPRVNDELDPTDPNFIVDIGVRHIEQVGFGLQASAGVDYYLKEGLYFGFEIKPVSYTFLYMDKIPGPGYDGLKSVNTSWSFFAQSFLKIGFKF